MAVFWYQLVTARLKNIIIPVTESPVWDQLVTAVLISGSVWYQLVTVPLLKLFELIPCLYGVLCCFPFFAHLVFNERRGCPLFYVIFNVVNILEIFPVWYQLVTVKI